MELMSFFPFCKMFPFSLNTKLSSPSKLEGSCFSGLPNSWIFTQEFQSVWSTGALLFFTNLPTLPSYMIHHHLWHPWPNSQSCQPSPGKGLELVVFLGLLRSMASPINQKAVKGAPWSSASSFCPRLGDELPTALGDLPGVCQLHISVEEEETLGLLWTDLDLVLQVHIGVSIINPIFWFFFFYLLSQISLSTWGQLANPGEGGFFFSP